LFQGVDMEEKFVVAADLGLSIYAFEDIAEIVGQGHGSSGLLLTEQR